MNFAERSMALLAATGGDTVKLFDVSVDPGDPCTLSYSPSPGSQVNSVKWNHTNLVVASAGDDKKITLWRKNGQSMWSIPVSGSESGDNMESSLVRIYQNTGVLISDGPGPSSPLMISLMKESIFSISFSNKVSRYICSGGTGQVVRIWDLQRKRCIKWLRGHTDTITGAMYNCKDEYLASISLNGDLILHNLASSAKVAELKDPNEQVLRVLDYSRISRHLLVTAGDDGSIHMWDTTGRNPKVSWVKQHSAPTAGVSFSPSNDKMIASVGLDKKLYTFDAGVRRPSFCIPYDVPFSSLAFRDDGWTLAAGTSSGQVVFYDVRAKPQPFTVLRAFSSSEAVTSLCWQRSKPVVVSENNCSPETALFGNNALEDSTLMPDPLPSVTSSTLALSTSLPVPRNPGRSYPSVESSTSSGFRSVSTSEETPHRNLMWTGGPLSRLHPARNFNFKDDMEVFSPLVEVQPITPSLDNLWNNDIVGAKKDKHVAIDKKPSLILPSSKRFPLSEEGGIDLHPVFDWKSTSTSRQDDTHSSTTQVGSTPAASSKVDDFSITPPEAWGGEKASDKFTHQRPPVTLTPRLGMLASGSLMSGSMFSGLQDLSLPSTHTSTSSSTNTSLNFANLRIKDNSNQENSMGFPEHMPFSSMSMSSLGTKGLSDLMLPRRFSTYAERISTASSFSDGALSPFVSSPKTKKTGAETREEFLNSLLSSSDGSASTEVGVLPSISGAISQPQKLPSQTDAQQGNSFTLQLFQRTLEETLATFQKSVHEDMRNLHIEILRQFHMQEMEMSTVLSSILANQAELMREVQTLRKENQQLRQLL